MGRSRSWVAGTLALAAALIAPTTASATVTCDVQNGGGLDIRITTSLEIGSIERSGENIVVREGTPVTCFNFSNQPVTPTISSTPVILMSSEPGLDHPYFIVSDAGGFSSIPIFVNLRNAPGSVLSVRIGAFAGPIVFGASGADTDPGANGDLDITANNVPAMDGRGGFGIGVDFTAQGGGSTGGALATGMTFLGSSAADSIQGGEGGDEMTALGDNDTLDGHGGDDIIKPGAGNDTVQGGPGTDLLDYSDLSAGVAIDLSLSGVQATGGGGNDTLGSVENVRGTTLVDILRGDGAPNRIEGLGGTDILDGRAGADEILASAGNDEVQARDGGPDTVNCGPGNDKVTADSPGVDTLVECEEIDFAPPPAPAGPTSPPRGTVLPVATVLPIARPPAITRLSLVPATFAAGGTAVTFNLNEAALVSFRVARRVHGRKRPTLLGGSFSRTGRVGLNRFHFNGRLKGHVLPAGSYQLQATPRVGASVGAAARAPFRVAG